MGHPSHCRVDFVVIEADQIHGSAVPWIFLDDPGCPAATVGWRNVWGTVVDVRGGPDPRQINGLAELAAQLDLLRARAARGSRRARVSLAELAGKVGVPRSTVHAYVSGLTLPPADVLDRIVIELGATAAEQAEWAEAWFRAAASSRKAAETAEETTVETPADPHAPHQLPPDVVAFTGRGGALAELDALLDRTDRPGAVVVTAIAGMAGVGKTALAVHWGHRVVGRFPDGQLYLNLRGHDTRPPVPTADALAWMLRDLGVDGAAVPASLDERIGRYRTLLASRRVLVILDNAASAEQVRDLLPGTPSCLVVVTSRDALAGLVARDGASRIDLDLLPVADAVSLLRELIGPRVDEEPSAVGALVQRCGRLPLALRIAAETARSRPGQPLADLVDELSGEHRLDALDAGGDAQTAVRTVFSWSYRQLPPTAAGMFRWLGVHPGRQFDVRAAAALACVDVAEAGRTLDRLLRAHLVERVSEDRFRMHDLLRAYAAELAGDLPVHGLVAYYRRTASAALGLAYPAYRHRLPPVPSHPAAPALADGAQARAWLAAELENLVAVVGLATERGHAEDAVRLATILHLYLDETSRWTEALAVHGHALTAARSIGDRAGEASALRNLGIAAGALGRQDEAIDRFEQSLAIREELGDRDGMAATLTSIGVAHDALGRFPEAIRYQRRCLALRLDIGDRLGAAGALLNLGVTLEQCGDHRNARDNYLQALAVFREFGDRLGESHALNNLGNVSRQLGHHDTALAYHQSALATYRQLGSRSGEAFAIAGLGMALDRLGHHHDAQSRHEQALRIAQEIGEHGLEAEILNNLGDNLLAQDRLPDAAATYRHALTIAQAHRDQFEHARSLHQLGQVLHAAGDPGARSYWQRARELYEQLGLPQAGVRLPD
jgi:tetratricopeptide (TPR) repeat protein/transcriptional regulator with XRE-family HTH domain